MNNQRGFTLTELLITTALSGFVGMAAYTVFASSNWSATVQQEVSQTQQSVRAATDRLAKDLRGAGFGVPDPPFTMTIGSGTFTSPVTITNSSTGPDTLTILGIGMEVGVLKTNSDPDCTNTASSTFICFSPTAGLDNKFTSGGTSTGAFLSARRYVSVGGIANFTLATTQTAAGNYKLKIDGSRTLGQDYRDVDNIPLFIVQAITYSITTDTSIDGCSATVPCLVGNDLTSLRGSGRQLYAEGIEDMQLAYYLKGGSDFVANASTSDTNLMAVRLNLVARTLTSDLKSPTGQSKVCLEDRSSDSACTSARDGYRRRALSQVVMIRNPRTTS